jgi:hypothetical protein
MCWALSSRKVLDDKRRFSQLALINHWPYDANDGLAMFTQALDLNALLEELRTVDRPYVASDFPRLRGLSTSRLWDVGEVVTEGTIRTRASTVRTEMISDHADGFRRLSFVSFHSGFHSKGRLPRGAIEPWFCILAQARQPSSDGGIPISCS